LWLIEADVFQVPQLHKHFSVDSNLKVFFLKSEDMFRLLFYGLLLISSTTAAQPTANKPDKRTQKLLAEVSAIIKKNSIHSGSMDWSAIGKEIGSLHWTENDSINYGLVFRFFIAKLREVGDRHSHFYTKSVSNYVKTQVPVLQPNGQYLEKGIGLIKVPYCSADQVNGIDFANKIRSEIQKIDTSHKITGWVVDLRHNTGGNMWPMLAGLNALMDDGTVGYFIYPTSKKERSWISKNGRITLPIGKVDTYKIRDTKVKIAVLIDSMTASSGEMTAISFIGLPNVKVFGQPSAGLTTGNTSFKLSDGTTLNLATVYVADRTKKPYLSVITPDVVVNANPAEVSDITVSTAKQWLLLPNIIEH
jgi:carboxyl-terminal processing protease